MDRFRNRFLSQVQILQNQLENLLQKDWGPEKKKDNQAPFEVLTDLGQLETLGWSLPDREPDRSQVLFDRLAPYFESGFCFHLESQDAKTQTHNWRLQSAFHLGEIAPLLPEDTEKMIAVPPMSLTDIRKLRPDVFLREMKFPEDVAGKETQALVIRPSEKRLWILFSNLPDVFLKPHVTAIQEVCLKLLADFLDEG